jgi:hypothetical protein
MIPKAMDGLDLVEVLMVLEEVFGMDITDRGAPHFGGPREMVDWLESHLSNRRPNKQSAALLRRLAENQGSPGLAERLDGTWRREQIAAVIREIFGASSSDDSSGSADPDAPVRAPIKPKPHPRSSGAIAVPEQER